MGDDEILTIFWDGEQLAQYWTTETEHRRWIRLALQEKAEELRAIGWAGIRPMDELVDFAVDNFDYLWCGSTLVAFTVSESWFNSLPVLSEEFACAFGNTPAENYFGGMAALAKHLGCGRVCTGTRGAGLRGRALARLSGRYGYTISTIELTKEVTK